MAELRRRFSRQSSSASSCSCSPQVCVQQTCLDLLERGVGVTLVVDGVSSQRPLDRAVALKVRGR